MAGRVLIAATGELDNSLSSNPSFSFFTKKYSKHVNYATENYKITFPEKVYTDNFLEVPIPQKYGDILRDVVLSFTVDPANAESIGDNIYPIDVFGISVIDYVELFVGEHKIDTVTGDDIFIDRELNVSESYRSSVNALHGKPFQGSVEPEFVQEFLDGQYNTRGIDPFSTNEYRIHIPFYFHRHPKNGFPLCAVYDQELTLRIKLRPSIDVLFVTQNKLDDATLWDPEANNQISQQLELSNFTVNLDFVHLDIAERCRLKNIPLNILFEQHQHNRFLIEPRSKTGTFKLNFSNCVKELFFIAKKFGHWTQEQIDILNRIHTLDSLSSSQVAILNEVRDSLSSLTIWEEIIRNAMIALDSLTGIDDFSERKNIVDVLREIILWGPNELTLLNDLQDSSNNSETIRTSLIEYLYSIPNIILNIQTTVNRLLDTIPPQTDAFLRANIIAELLVIQNLWGPKQIEILNKLSDPNVENESSLIFEIRTFVSQITYFLVGLEALTPNSPEQLNVINGLEGFLDEFAIKSDILKLGLITVLNTLPGKTATERGTIVDGLIRIGAEATIWGETQITQLNASREVGVDTHIATLTSHLNSLLSSDDPDQRVRIKGILFDLGEFPTTLEPERLERVTALRQFDVWRDETIKVVKNVEISPPGTSGRTSNINSLIEYSNVLIDSIPTIQFTLNNLKKSGVNGILDTLPDTIAGRDPIIIELVGSGFWGDEQFATLNALRFPSTNDTTYINQLKATSTQEIVTQSTQNDVILQLLTRSYWGEEVFTLNNLRLVAPGFIGQGALVTALNTYINGLPQSLNITNLLNNVLATTTQETRNPLIDDLIALGVWSDVQLGILEDLRDPDFNDISNLTPEVDTRINLLKIGIDATLDSLPSSSLAREPIIDSLIALGIWGTGEITILNELRIPSTEDDPGRIASLKNFISSATQTPSLIILDRGVATSVRGFNLSRTRLQEVITSLQGTLPAIEDGRYYFIDGIVAETGVWGTDQITLLDELRTSTPTENIEQLVSYIKGILFTRSENYLADKTESDVQDIITILNTDPLPEVGTERTTFINTLKVVNNFWGTEQIALLDALITSTPTGYIEQLVSYVNGILFTFSNDYDQDKTNTELQDIITLLEGTLPAVEDGRYYFVSDLLALGIWGGQGSNETALLEDLRTSVAPTSIVTDLVAHVTEIRNTVIALNSDSLDTATRDNIVDALLELRMWSTTQKTLLDVEFRVVGSQDHDAIVDGLVTYLDGLKTLATTFYNPLTGLGLLTTLLNTTDVTEHNTIVATLLLATDTVWDGYFFRLLEELKDPAIATGTETTHISELQNYVNITFFTAGLNRNIVFLLTQPTVRYPASVFNKWARGKKHVPLMYSKQNQTTLTCDGEIIIDEITGNNLFLSTSLPNIYHKRSPVFRNINMYSFALHPGELEPSGHLNFSTVNDARLTMNLEYDGSQGTFDFDDNFIEVLGIPQIDFPKQVIIIAKSYNMMIIRDGKAQILFR